MATGAAIAGAIISAVSVGSSIYQAEKQREAQENAANIQANAQKTANDIQARAQSTAEQQNNRANAQKVNASAIMGAITNGFNSNLTGAGGISSDRLSLGKSSTLKTNSRLGGQNSSLGSSSSLGTNNNGTLF